MEKIGEGRTADIYSIAGSKILKLYKPGFPEEPIQEEFATSQFVHSLGIRTPQPYELTSSENRTGIVFQRIIGTSLLNLMKSRPWFLKKYAKSLAAVHYQLHTQEANGLERRQKDVLRYQITAAPLLSEEEKAVILDDLDKLPDDHKLCHGDFHPDNILVGDGHWVIDWMSGAAGNPLCDVARTVTLLRFGTTPERMPRLAQAMINFFRNRMLNEYIGHYLQLSGQSWSDVEKWQLPVAAARLSEWIPQAEKEQLLQLIKNRVRAISS